MAGIQDLGNGRGIIYMTDLSSNILKIAPNTNQGAINIRANGLVVAPLAARRAAYGTLTVTSAAGSGTITAVNVNGVNQISSPITVASTSPSVVAAQIATAINNNSSSTPDCTAVAVGAIVYISTPQSLGATANGYVIAVSVTGGAIEYTSTALTNGSSDDGLVDTNLGKLFYLNADYDGSGLSGGGTASPSNLTNAIEITKYMVNRGLQTGLLSDALTIASGSLNSFDRSSSITVVEIATEGGAPTDALGQINSSGCVVGDILMLRAATASNVVTIEDYRTTTSGAAAPNLILNNGQQFVTDGSNTLMVQLREVSGVGLCWAEIGRSTASSTGSGLIVLSTVEAQTLISTYGVIRGQKYHITDYPETDMGIIVEGTGPSTFDKKAAGGYFLPAYDGSGNFSSVIGFNSYLGTWWPGVMAIGDVVSYEGYNFKNTTGVNGSDPLNNTGPDWELIDKSITKGYYVEWHFLVVNLTAVTSSIVQRTDGRGNTYFTNNTANHLRLKWGVSSVSNNFITEGGLLNNLNAHNGSGGLPTATNLQLKIGSSVQQCDSNVVLSGVSLEGTSITNCSNAQISSASFINCNITNITAGGRVQNLHAVQSTVNDILNSYISGRLVNSRVSNFNGNSLGGDVFNRSVSGLFLSNTQVENFTWEQDRRVFNLNLSNCTVKNKTFRPTTDITGAYPVTTTDNGFGNIVLENVYLDFKNNWDESFIVGLTSIWTYGYESVYANQLESNIYGWLDISAASVYNASTKTLTLPGGYDALGEIWLKNTAGEDIRIINNIVNYDSGNGRQHMMFGKKFRVYDGTGVTFTPIAAASYNEAAAATGVTNGFMGTAPVTISRECEYVHIKRIFNQIYVDKYVVVT